MTKKWSAALLVAACMVATTTMLLAQNPHFLSASASLDGEGNLQCSFRLAGLGSNETILVECTANATAEYACINNGGKKPSAANKETVNGPVSGSGEFTSGKNGSVRGSVTAFPPDEGSFSCPNGQELTLCSVSYNNLALTATQDGEVEAATNVSGTLSDTLDSRCF